MLFKQWNDLAEPRHQLMSPSLSTNIESLQLQNIPEVSMTNLKYEDFENVIVTTKTMNALFPNKTLNLTKVGELSSSLVLNENEKVPTAEHYSWDYKENFPNEVDIYSQEAIESEIGSNESKKYNFQIPIMAYDKTLLISIEENFIKMSPIFSNLTAEKILKVILTFCNSNIGILTLGTSDRVAAIRKLTPENSTLVAPEFITGFVGSFISQLVILEVPNYKAVIVPSEGPIGFEKLSIETISELIDICKENLNINDPKYSNESHRLWKVAGSAMGAQTGLYI
ncbi:hypothetical protein TPHA_0F03000 [Tetrapisispora phaffii CBS 4417]|uniref:Proteasome assembly chaperone 1 n=1 Tax=Tetrapisispora phaffii (strain ATCC 24235 / CBS 4417 / NBRC 1672 / NRRL Y-8282 / UCD 70-5) TaxID=1071381 RepID=G8BUJ5_TETPH|nr:hypothetical protein TPHA_0F03000 [Tetrapisispora phaffii CBS 4417]CCE63781.1 hypothetical protein TPHA_0F03000 [Tetrapisispora phaffii CBS 4417]